MSRLLLATRNPGKLRELAPLLREAGFGELRLETLADHSEVAEMDEEGKTFEENARSKALFAARVTHLWALGEDSGLEVDALLGMPGVLSARYAGHHGDDAANNARLLRELEGLTDRSARFVCTCALASPDGEIVAIAGGTCEGRIVGAPCGEGGFGYDPLFVPEGEERTMAELRPDEKAALSHRGRALRALVPALERHLQ